MQASQSQANFCQSMSSSPHISNARQQAGPQTTFYREVYNSFSQQFIDDLQNQLNLPGKDEEL